MTEKRGLGRPKTPELASITFRVPDGIDQAIRELADREYRTISGQIVHMLEHYILFGQRALQPHPSDFGQMVAQARHNNERGI
jgi:hypothetical protein